MHFYLIIKSDIKYYIIIFLVNLLTFIFRTIFTLTNVAKNRNNMTLKHVSSL